MVTVIQRQHSCGASADCQKSDSSMVRTQKWFQNLVRITIFKTVVLLIPLCSLMICTHSLIILTKEKEMTCYCESFRYSGKILSSHVYIILTWLTVPTKNTKHALMGSSTFVPTYDPSGLALVCPIMSIIDQNLRAQSSLTNYSQIIKVFINNKRSIRNHNIYIKATNNKISSSIRK
jgi:hypothetical protein